MVGDIQASEFIINPNNLPPLHRFLKETSLGHTKHLCFDQTPTTDDNESDHLYAPEPDFGVFQPSKSHHDRNGPGKEGVEGEVLLLLTILFD